MLYQGHQKFFWGFARTPVVSFASTPTTQLSSMLHAIKSVQKSNSCTLKKCHKLLQDLRHEEQISIKGTREWPYFEAGDAIQLTVAPFLTSSDPDIHQGVVMARFNRDGPESSFIIINCEQGIVLERHFRVYDPLIKDIKVLMKAFVHHGRRRVRRAKLYYLRDRDPIEFTVNYTKSDIEILKAKGIFNIDTRGKKYKPVVLGIPDARGIECYQKLVQKLALRRKEVVDVISSTLTKNGAKWIPNETNV